MNEKFSLEKEQEKRSRQENQLNELGGFQKLSERQQALINHALYIQARSERPATTRTASRDRRTGPDVITSSDDGVNSYEKSQEHRLNWYCHAVIYSLENEFSLDLEPQRISPMFFKAEYFRPDESDLLSEILDKGFPCVVHLSLRPDIWQDQESQIHTFVALGINPQGEVIVFEKRGYGLEYHLTTLQETIQESEGHLKTAGYKPKDYGIGVRKLRKPEYYKSLYEGTLDYLEME